MSRLRSTTIKEIETILNNSYFTKDSFVITNTPNKSPFLRIEFIPIKEFNFIVKSSSSYSYYTTSESPGIHMASIESYKRDDFNKVKDAIDNWVDRIKEDLDSKNVIDEEVETFLNKLRSSFERHENEEGSFTDKEVNEIIEKLNTLELIVVEQAEKLEASEYTINSFKEELENIKRDLPKYEKGVWYKISGNKVIKSIRNFISTSEGRKLIADEIRKLLE